jgi:predicted nucleic acid-binding protein
VAASLPPIFVDTGAFLALYRRRDQNHQSAVQIWSDLSQKLVTSNLVMAELGALLVRSLGGAEAADRLSELFASPSIEILRSTKQNDLDALQWMRKYADHEIGYTDCVSFAIMRQHKIRTVFGFDRHFRLAGFDLIGSK